jgi:hypothetical protein
MGQQPMHPGAPPPPGAPMPGGARCHPPWRHPCEIRPRCPVLRLSFLPCDCRFE